jgi:hypothetical protein
MLVFLGAGSEVDIREGIKFVEHNIAVVGTYTGGDTRDAFAVVFTCNGMELAALDIALNTAFIKERSHHIYATLVAY